jgi:hypothetical protein
MKEEEFIKKYFENKKSINESEILKQVAGNVIDFVTDSNPIAKLAKSAMEYSLSRGGSRLGDYIGGKTTSFFSSDSKSSSSQSKKSNKSEKIINLKTSTQKIRDSANLYLKYIVLDYFLNSDKKNFNENAFIKMYNDIISDDYTNEKGVRFIGTSKIKDKATINNKAIDKDSFSTMMNEIGVKALNELLKKSQGVLKNTNMDLETQVNTIFKDFYALKPSVSKIGN